MTQGCDNNLIVGLTRQGQLFKINTCPSPVFLSHRLGNERNDLQQDRTVGCTLRRGVKTKCRAIIDWLCRVYPE